MKNKKLQILVQKAVRTSFKKNKIDQKAVTSFIKSFKKLSLGEAIESLTLYKKGLQRLINKHTLFVESPVSLSKTEINNIVRKFNSTFIPCLPAGRILHSTFSLNPSLLGGLKLKIGDQVFDDTLKNRIDQLRLELSK